VSEGLKYYTTYEVTVRASVRLHQSEKSALASDLRGVKGLIRRCGVRYMF
jgi:hypothetical protein